MKRPLSPLEQKPSDRQVALVHHQQNNSREVGKSCFKDGSSIGGNSCKLIKQEPVCKQCNSGAAGICSCHMPKVLDNDTKMATICSSSTKLSVNNKNTNLDNSVVSVDASENEMEQDVGIVEANDATTVSGNGSAPSDASAKEGTGGGGDTLDDIPTLADLAKQSPKVIHFSFS